MEVLILDSLLRPIDVVDVFVSMIWTERFSEMGDFELVTLSSSANKKRFVIDTVISITESRRLMRVLTIEDAVDEDGRKILKIKGKEISLILDSRIAMTAVGSTISPSWFITGKTPGDVMRHIFKQICVDGILDTADIIPFIQYGVNQYPADTIPEPSELIEWEQKPASVFSALKELGDIYDLGHRLYKDPNLSKLYFNVYSGSDRTTAQTTLPPVVFSEDMENLQNTTELSDVSQHYNIINVIYTFKDELDNDAVISLMVTEDVVNPPEGFDRRIKPLVITNIPEEVTDVTAYLIRAGADELARSRPLGAFDGEINPNSTYVYERDYYLGDLVEIRDTDGASSYMRVEEYIFVQDDQGQRSYPTLTLKKFINPGTWLSWKYDVEWVAMGPDEYWANQ